MSLAVFFWVCYILSIVIGGYANRGRFLDNGWFFGFGVLLYVLLGTLGYAAFGPIVR